MRWSPSPYQLAALLALWVAACVAAFFASSDAGFLFAYFVLPVSALVVPLVVGRLGAQIYCPPSVRPEPSPRAHAAMLFVLAVLSYLLCVMVLARMLEIPWRQAKFGDPVLSLGRSAAQMFFLAAGTVAAVTAFILGKLPRSAKAARFGGAALAMLAAACLAYLAVGLSPLVEWRA